MLDKPVREQYALLQRKNGASLWQHLLVDSGPDEFFLLVKTGSILLNLFQDVRILPSLHEADIIYRRKLMPGVKNNKNPDFKIDGIYWELECPTYPYNYNKIVQRIRKGYNQADQVILYFAKVVNGFTIQKAVQDRFKIRKDFMEAIIIIGDKVAARLKNKPGKQTYRDGPSLSLIRYKCKAFFCESSDSLKNFLTQETG